ncbi:MAG: SRPBCC family protein [Flavobacteriales bacterium]|nr:SRPBCC family protein [Flavobacteriales bacterium]MBP9080014.1 SRPBCC family protein [Flavobacteriales bacterium]
MLLYILLGLALLLAIILLLASTKPDTVHYERSTVIHAAPDMILPHITDFHRWTPWSPWEKLDPAMKREFTGNPEGVGAKYAWSGTKKAGTGTMEILEADSAGVKIDLRFIKPWRSDCIALFEFTPQANGTFVRWSLDGPNTFMGKVFGLFMDMDKLVGKDFEAGLAGLKGEVEKG